MVFEVIAERVNDLVGRDVAGAWALIGVVTLSVVAIADETIAWLLGKRVKAQQKELAEHKAALDALKVEVAELRGRLAGSEARREPRPRADD